MIIADIKYKPILPKSAELAAAIFGDITAAICE